MQASTTARTLPSVGSLLIAAALAAGCVDEPPGPPYRAEVVAYTGFDRATGTPRYELAARELSTLEDFHHLRGSWFTIIRGGELLIREVAGSVVTDGRFAGGEAAAPRYFLDGDVAVGRDYASVAMLSAFHEMERVFESLETSTGVAADELVGSDPFEIFFEPRIRLQSDIDATVTIKRNAFFVPEHRQFGLARRSELETVPLGLDRMVLAHEVGHAIFEKVVFGGRGTACEPGAPLTDLDARLRTEFVVSGFNEGFADLVSFAVTGSTNPLAGVEAVGDERSLDGRAFTFGVLPDVSVCRGAFYCVGTLLARALYAVFLDAGGDPDDAASRGQLGSEIVAALAATPATLAEREALPAPSARVERCEHTTSLDRDYDGRVAGAFLDAFASNMPEAVQPALCEALIERFGASGFPEAARITCAEEQP